MAVKVEKVDSCLLTQGTEIYDAKRGALVDLGILDVMQIFGRAGRPQFDKYGEGTIITTHDKLSHYLTLLTQQNPIESQFLGSLADNLNAEVSVQLVFGLGRVQVGSKNHNVCRFLILLVFIYKYVALTRTEGVVNVLAAVNRRLHQMATKTGDGVVSSGSRWLWAPSPMWRRR